MPSDQPHIPTWQQERFSLAYISAVVSHAGFQLASPEVDNDSIDGIIQSTHDRRPKVDFQAKATGQDLLREDDIAFPLSIKNYNDLRIDSFTPRILIVVLLPPTLEHWLLHSEEQLVMKHCGYWLSLRDAPATDNQTSVTVRIPRAQRFDGAQLSALMQRVNDGGFS